MYNLKLKSNRIRWVTISWLAENTSERRSQVRLVDWEAPFLLMARSWSRTSREWTLLRKSSSKSFEKIFEITEMESRLLNFTVKNILLTRILSHSHNAKASPHKPFLGTRTKAVNEKGETGKCQSLLFSEFFPRSLSPYSSLLFYSLWRVSMEDLQTSSRWFLCSRKLPPYSQPLPKDCLWRGNIQIPRSLR